MMKKIQREIKEKSMTDNMKLKLLKNDAKGQKEYQELLA